MADIIQIHMANSCMMYCTQRTVEDGDVLAVISLLEKASERNVVFNSTLKK